LPEGGSVPINELNSLADELSRVVTEACKITDMKRDDDARALWCEIYPKLSAEGFGLSGSVCNRAEAQVLRLSMLYALSDGSAVINRQHLEAALAFWGYCKASAEYLFRDRLADANAQRILNGLRVRPGGMTRKIILDEIFQRNTSRDALDLALTTLESLKLARKEAEQTGGRPAERWFAV
jgi:hypothetical protein